MFEWTINIGSLLIMATTVFTLTGLYWRLKNDTTNFREDVVDIKLELKSLNKVIVDLALQTQRLDIMEKTLYELRHGQGLVK
ncbi:MAG TPA: hypothetical protein VGJ00_04030 [Rhabdochlamydiaceae bacterium]|jgi:hypothetical protein